MSKKECELLQGWKERGEKKKGDCGNNRKDDIVMRTESYKRQ